MNGRLTTGLLGWWLALLLAPSAQGASGVVPVGGGGTSISTTNNGPFILSDTGRGTNTTLLNATNTGPLTIKDEGNIGYRLDYSATPSLDFFNEFSAAIQFSLIEDGNFGVGGITYTPPPAQGFYDSFLRNDGTGATDWTNALQNLTVVSNFTVEQTTILSNVSVKGSLFVTNIFINGESVANVRTNQYTTNISGTPVIGSQWWQGTNGTVVTNGQRVAMEYIPVMRSWRAGELGDSIHPSNLGGNGTNYWNATNLGVMTFGFGSNVQVKARFSSITGGRQNLILTNSDNSFIGGGYNNFIDTNSVSSVIAGGGFNQIYGTDTLSQNSFRTISGGSNNIINGAFTRGSVISGGGDNSILIGTAGYATIAGGVSGDINVGGHYGFIGGGFNNTLGDGTEVDGGGVLVGGLDNTTRGNFAFLGGGKNNRLFADDNDGSVVVGGSSNTVGVAAGDFESKYAAIVGGFQNTIGSSATFAFIGGGNLNSFAGSSTNSFIGGGFNNLVSSGGHGVSILGGLNNLIDANGDLGTITGGTSNSLSAAMTFAVGNFITNSTASTVDIGHGASGGNNRKLRVDQNGARVLNYAASAAVGGTYLHTNTVIFNAGSSETNLQAVTIGAHVLTNNNDRLLVRASGRFAATANAKEVRLWLGSEMLMTSGSQVNNGGAWVMDAEIIRTGNTAQSCNATFTGGTNIFFQKAVSLDLAQTNGIATVLKLTGVAAGNGDITNRTLTVEWRPAP